MVQSRTLLPYDIYSSMYTQIDCLIVRQLPSVTLYGAYVMRSQTAYGKQASIEEKKTLTECI